MTMVKKQFLKMFFQYFKRHCCKANRRSDSWSSVEKINDVCIKSDAEMKITQTCQRNSSVDTSDTSPVNML